MRNVCFMRHGETVQNVESKICGATEGALAGWRREQAYVVSREIRARTDAGELQIDRMFYSPLSHARGTTQEIADILRPSLAIEPRLQEQNFGIWEGIARNGEDLQHAKENFIDSLGADESMLRLAQRIYNLSDDVRVNADHTCLLVTHNSISHMVESYFRDIDSGEFASFGVRNVAPHIYCYPEEVWES